MTLEEAARAYRRAEKTLEERRAGLAEAIVAEAKAGRPQVEIVAISGYAREHVRRIVRAAEQPVDMPHDVAYRGGNRPGTTEDTMTRTDRDVRDQVQQATDASEGTFDVPAITEAIVARWGCVDIDAIDHDEFWALVGQHATD